MLFSSGDSSRTLASILSGEGFDAGKRGIAVLHFGCNTQFPPTYPNSSVLSIAKPSNSYPKVLLFRTAHPSDVQGPSRVDKLNPVKA